MSATHECIVYTPTHSRLVSYLGSGQFGTVEKGVWESPFGLKDVAVKTLNPGASDIDRVRFLKEAAIMGQFSHPNVVEMFGIITEGEPVSFASAGHTHMGTPTWAHPHG